MRHVVFVSYFYPPMTAVGGLRTQGWAAEMARMHEVIPIVVTVGSQRSTSADEGVTVVRTRDLRIRRPSLMGRQTSAISGPSPAGRSVQSARGILGRMKDELLFPDEQALWLTEVRWAKKALRTVLGEDTPLAVVASAPPSTSLLVGRTLAREWRVPLIADYRDLWTNNPFVLHSGLRRRIDRRLERQVSRSYDAVTLATSGLADGMPFSKRERDVSVVEVLTGVEVREGVPAVPETGPFRVLHAGQLYGGLRDPRPAIAACRAAAEFFPDVEIELVFVGRDARQVLGSDAGRRDNLNVVARDEVGLGAARELMDASHVLLSISWNDERDNMALPGKLYEYLASRRPVLCFGPPNRRLSRLLGELDGGLLAEDSQQGAAYLAGLIEEWESGQYHGLTREQIEPISKAHSAAELWSIIETVA